MADIEDSLARLRAGLDEDERSAQTALQGPARLESDWKVVTYKVDLDDRQVQTVADSSGVFLAPELACLSTHIARQDPKSTLDRVEAIRRVIAEARDPKSYESYDSADIDYDSFREGIDAAVDLFTRILASIYPTTEEMA